MRVLVVCNAGMSSSILVKKMKDYAASQGEELMIKAVCSAAAEDEAGEWDVCLVGPQLMHAVDEIAEAVEKFLQRRWICVLTQWLTEKVL